MLLPDKHIRLSESILGLSAFVLQHVDAPRTLDELAGALSEANKANTYPASHGIDHIVLAVAFLYSIGLIEANTNGALIKCD